MSYVLVTGGVRSGKSRWAEQLLERFEQVLYVATGQAFDAEMEQRIKMHQARRPNRWALLEASDRLAAALKKQSEWECVLIDCISTWISRILLELPDSEWRTEATRQRVLTEASELAEWLQKHVAHSVVVTSETGLGGVAMTPLGRAFQDLLGEVNQRLAEQADAVYLLVSGRPLRLPAPEELSECEW